MRDTTFIYALCEPGVRVIRYFGKADRPKARFGRHLRIEKQHLHCARWIASLKGMGQIPDMYVLCEVPKNDFERFERAFIALGRQAGMFLTNLTDGGEGPSGYKQTSETIAKRVAKIKGLKRTPVQRLNQSFRQMGRKGTKHTPEWKAAQSRRLSGVKKSPSHCLAMSLCRRGEKHPQFGKKSSRNSSGFLGVSFYSARKRWVAVFRAPDRSIKHVGYFEKIEDAVFARNLAIANLL